MDESPHREPQRSSGAFLGPDVLMPVPTHTLSDDIPREPDEVEAERRGKPDAERAPRGLRDRIRRLFGRGQP